MSREKSNEVLRKSFRGYNVDDVDELIDTLNNDISSLKAECASLYEKLKASKEEVEKYRRTEAVSGDIIKEAKTKADGIVNDAKGRAARVIIRTSRQCNRIVADMVSQVEEQKNIYETAKQEVLKFRRDLFNLYADHVKKINAYSEAAGVFDADALSQSELESFIKLLGNDDIADDRDEGFGDTETSAQIEEKVNRIKMEAAHSAEELLREKQKAIFDTEPVSDAREEKIPEEPETEIIEKVGEPESEEVSDTLEHAEKDSDSDEKAAEGTEDIEESEEELPDDEPEDGALFGFRDTDVTEVSADDIGELKLESEPDEKAAEEEELELDPVPFGADDEDDKTPDLVIDEEDIGEFGAEGPIGNAVNEFDGPVSLNDVFGSLSSYDDVDFEAVYGEKDDEKSAEKGPTPEEILEKRRLADDDSNEFYNEEDIEFDPFVAPAEPTAQVSISKPADAAPQSKKRWKLKRSMTITDEFKAVKSEGEDD